jgi:hypothetical protein
MTEGAKGAITTGDQRPEMPALIRELASLINRMDFRSNCWLRFRIAVTHEEMEAYKAFVKADGGTNFAQAVRGLPLQIEDHPTNPAYCIEYFKDSR